MKKFRFIYSSFSFLITLFLIGCSGGGGSDSATSRPSTGFRVLHADLDATPFDINIEPETNPRSSCKFSTSSDWISASGDLSINLLSSNTSIIERNINIKLKDNQVRSILVYKSFSDLTAITSIDDSLPTMNSGSAAVRVINGAYGTSPITANIGGKVLNQNVSYGASSDYFLVSAGSAVNIRVLNSIDNSVLYNEFNILSDGKAYTIFISGNLSYLIKGKLLEDN